jgi:hypothetical protein
MRPDYLAVLTMLPDPPVNLAPAPRAFYDELREMLRVVRPGDLDPSGIGVEVDRDGALEVTLPHGRQSDWAIVACIGRERGIVHAGPAHEHFDSVDGPTDRPWSTEAVDFIAEVLRGEFEIECVFRGRALIKIKHYLRDDEGRHPMGTTGLLRPGLLMFWRPTRTEVTTIDFGAQG